MMTFKQKAIIKKLKEDLFYSLEAKKAFRKHYKLLTKELLSLTKKYHSLEKRKVRIITKEVKKEIIKYKTFYKTLFIPISYDGFQEKYQELKKLGFHTFKNKPFLLSELNILKLKIDNEISKLENPEKYCKVIDCYNLLFKENYCQSHYQVIKPLLIKRTS